DLKEQDEAKAVHHAPKLSKETGEIDWTQPATAIHNLVRGLSPFPAAWTRIKDKTCKIYSTKVIPEHIPEKVPGEHWTAGKNDLYFQTGAAILSVLELQLEGKKRLGIEEFLRGFKL